MRSSTLGHPIGWGALSVLCGLVWGCEPPPVGPADDAGVTVADAEIPLPDAGEVPPPPPPPGECTTHADCADDNPCTSTFCEDGMCWAQRVEGCFECATDADCDDGFACSIERCEGSVCAFEWSPACECLSDGDCDDGNPATRDACTSDFRCTHEARTCATSTDCDDADPCTADACEASACVSSRIPGCGTTCPDRDGDGHGSRFCFGGDDCDDASPSVHPGATEACDDGVDNDCDGRVDRVDDDCSVGGDTCATARPLVSGVPLDGAVITDGSIGTGGTTCGTPSFHTLTLTETSDVQITLTLSEPPPPTPVPGCPECTADHEWEYWFNVFLETACGDVTTDPDGAGGCRVFGSDTFFGGDGTLTRLVRRVPAGAYTVEVQASDWRGWMPAAIEFSLQVDVTPADAPACGAATVLTEGAASPGRTGTGTDAFDRDCRGAALRADEALHTFTLASRRRVRLEAVGVPDPTSGVAPGLRIGLHDGCDPAATRVDCLEHTGRECHERATLERTLDPGTYWVVVEGVAGGDAGYELTLSTEGVNTSCRSAPVIAGSGSRMGDTTGAADAFRDREICGDGYAPDDVYRVDVATDSRVVLDVIASYPDALLTLYRGCGETQVAGGRGRTRVDVSLTASTYYAVVGGAHPTDAGAYVLNSTFVPSP